jgi:hypothetical protein
MQIARFEDGKIIERWGSSDELGMLLKQGRDAMPLHVRADPPKWIKSNAASPVPASKTLKDNDPAFSFNGTPSVWRQKVKVKENSRRRKPDLSNPVRFGVVRSTGQCNTACSLSAGVWKPKVFRGR